MVSNSSQLQAISYMAMPKVSSGGKAYFPVPGNQVLYSHFKYVSGFAEKSGRGGVSIDKLRILNSIIDQLVSMKTNEAEKQALSTSGIEKLSAELDESSLDSLINYYHEEIKKTIIQTENIGYGGTPLPAAVLDLTA